MILYSVNYRGALSNDEWSIVTIWKTRERAEEAMSIYENNWSKVDKHNTEYTIVEIDTDSDNDCVYDFEDI